jgi:methylenetetrahydrofolate reductase (NADPH)
MNMSIEITTRNTVTLPLDYQEVFITWLPTESKDKLLAKVTELHGMSLKPVPHIASNKIKDIAEARDIAAALIPFTNKILLIRGGGEQEGTFANVTELVDTGAFAEFEIGVGGFPDGNGPISYEDGIEILRAKTSYAKFVVTQWSLNQKAIARFLDDTPLPTYLGVPNHCSTKQLIRFAKVCGIENSVKGFLSNPMNLMRFVTGFNPTYIVEKFKTHPNLAKFHVYSFGNLAKL